MIGETKPEEVHEIIIFFLCDIDLRAVKVGRLCGLRARYFDGPRPPARSVSPGEYGSCVAFACRGIWSVKGRAWWWC